MDDDSPTTSLSKPSRDAFFNDLGTQRKEPYLERALKRVNSLEGGKMPQLKPSLKSVSSATLTNLSTRKEAAGHNESAYTGQNN